MRLSPLSRPQGCADLRSTMEHGHNHGQEDRGLMEPRSRVGSEMDQG